MTRIKLDFIHEFIDRHGTPRRYFRRRGFKRVSLPGLPGSDEFMGAYQAALASGPKESAIGADRTKPGTVNALVIAYYASDAWTRGVTEDTRKTRRRIIERFRARHGDKRVALLQREHLQEMLAEIGKPSAQRHWLKAIRGLMRAAGSASTRSRPRGRSAVLSIILALAVWNGPCPFRQR